MGRFRRVVKWLVKGRERGLRARLRRRVCGSRQPEPAVAPPVVAPPPPRADDYVDVCAVTDLADGEVAEFIARDTSIAIARIDGTFHALSNVCPHAGGPIGDGDVQGNAVRCPLHGWAFDVSDGSCEVDPSIHLRVFAVRERGGRVEVEIPATP